MAHLLTMYQEMVHYQNELVRSNEQDLFQLLDACSHLHQKWQASENDLAGAKRILLTYENDVGQLRVENKELKGKLVESRSQVAGLIAARNDVERERAIFAAQVDMVRDLLRDDINGLPEYSRKKLQFLNDRPSAAVLPRNTSCSVVTGDIDYDRTDDSLEEDTASRHHSRGATFGGRKKRSVSLTRLIPSAPGIENELDEQTPRKRSRDDMRNPDDGDHLSVASAYREKGYRSPLNRSFSEPNVGGGLLFPPGAYSAKSMADLAKLSPATAPATGRRHAFLSKTALKAEYCDHCEKRFGFAGTMWRCDICKIQCHADCRDRAMLPCVGRGTPSTKNQRGKLLDFVPRDPPMVPNVIVYCVNEIERRGLTSLGLYRVSGSEAQVVDLLDKFLHGRSTPNLRQFLDISVLSGCVKKFLQQLAEPLIPPASFSEFVSAGELNLEGKDASLLLHKAISELPQPNRDTLAFLMIHLQNVVAHSSENKMTMDNLALIFAPTVLGSSSSQDFYIATQAVEKATAAMKGLFDMPPDYWGRFLSKSEHTPLMGNLAAASPMFFDSNKNRGANTSLFGPINSGISTTPKAYASKGRNDQRKFFNPPWK